MTDRAHAPSLLAPAALLLAALALAGALYQDHRTSQLLTRIDAIEAREVEHATVPHDGAARVEAVLELRKAITDLQEAQP